MKKINLVVLLISYSIFSQEIKWTSVPNDKINPSVLLSKGIIELENGDKTPKADLYIDFKNEKIFYRNIKSNGIYSIFKENFSKISVSDYKDGEFVKGNVFYGDVGEEIGASLRKGLYKVANLNIMKITSVEKEGFFNRKQPKFYINSSGELDVSNKAIVTSKILGITPSGIGYLDSEGDLWLRNNNSARNISAGEGENKASKREEKREARKQARILNINIFKKSFLNTGELYKYFYEEYEKNFYTSLEQFKDDFKGKNLRELLTSWGPFTEKFELDSGSTLFVWSFERKFTEKETISLGASSIISNSTQSSSKSASATLSSQYGINSSSSKYNLGGYGSVMDSYSQIRGESFLNYYSKNIVKQWSASQSFSFGKSTTTEVMTDDTKKIGLIVNKELIIEEVIAKNYFPKPYFGVTINFID